MATSTTVRLIGLEGVLATLQSLPPEVVSRRGGVIRAALRKAAAVIQKQEIANLEQIISVPNVGGEDRSTGLLAKNVVVSRSRPRSGTNGERFLVRVRNKAYPKRSPNAKRVTTAQVARLLEYGTEKRAPLPFIRPAFDAKKDEAVRTFVEETDKGIERAYKKLARMNRQKP